MALPKTIKLGGTGHGRLVRKQRRMKGVIEVKSPRQTWRIR